MADLTLDARIKKEKSKIKRLYKNMAPERLESAEKLIERAAYMVVSLEDMEKIISRDGLVIEMQQGDYTIERAHPLLTPYNAMVKNYSSVVKQLNEMIPEEDAKLAGQSLLQFITKPQQKGSG